MQTGIVRHGLGRDRLDDGHQSLAQIGQERAQRRDLHAIVGHINQRVGDVLIARKEIRILPAQVERPVQVRLHGSKIVRRTRPRPRLVRRRRLAIELRHERRRHLDRFLVIAPRDADEAGLVRIVRQARLVGPQVIQQLTDGRVGEFFVRQPSQRRHLTPTGLRAAWRHVRGLIPAQQCSRRPQVVDDHQAGLEFDKFGVHAFLQANFLPLYA